MSAHNALGGWEPRVIVKGISMGMRDGYLFGSIEKTGSQLFIEAD